MAKRRVVMVEPALRMAPSGIRVDAEARFEEIAAGVEGISQDSVFWESAKVSRLCLVVRGWSFFYTLDEQALRVIEVRAP